MGKEDFGCIIGIFVALVGVKFNLIKPDTWFDILGYIICFSISTYILNMIDKKLFKKE